MPTITTIANRDSKRVRDNRKKPPCTVYVQGSPLVNEYQAQLDAQAERELLAMQKPQ